MTDPGYSALHRPERRAYDKKYYQGNRKKRRKQMNNALNTRRRRYKEEAFEHYGRFCVCCGEPDKRFLTFDHIKGKGNVERRKMGSRRLVEWLRLRGWPKGYQTMCWNCNCGRHFNGGVCPHKDNYCGKS